MVTAAILSFAQGFCRWPLLFALTFAATRYGRTKKEFRGVSESGTGRRASQVIANLGIAAFLVALGKHNFLQYTAALAALAEATADTVSSEIGQAIGGPTFLITTSAASHPVPTAPSA